MEFGAEEWGRKGATLSDKTACSQYGLTQEEIYAAIDAGKLQYPPAAMHGTRGCGCSAARSKTRSGPGVVTVTVPGGAEGADRSGADQPRAEATPGLARRLRGKAGRAPGRIRRRRR